MDDVTVQQWNGQFVLCVWSVDVTPSAVHVGNIVQGVRMAWAQGRDLGAVDDESDAAKKVGTVLTHVAV